MNSTWGQYFQTMPEPEPAGPVLQQAASPLVDVAEGIQVTSGPMPYCDPWFGPPEEPVYYSGPMGQPQQAAMRQQSAGQTVGPNWAQTLLGLAVVGGIIFLGWSVWRERKKKPTPTPLFQVMP